MNKRGSQVSKEQMLVAFKCLKDAQRLKVENLGTPPQEQTGQACLTNDVRNRVGKRTAKLVQREADKCLAEPGQLPDFGYTNSAAIAFAATTQSLELVEDLFGDDLDAAIVLAPASLPGADPKGAQCQAEVLKRTRILLHTLWKQALKAKKNAFKGKKDTQVESAAQLQDDILAFLAADPQERVSKASLKLEEKSVLKCGDSGVVTPLADMFLGQCGGSVDPSQLAACAIEQTRCRFCESLNAFDGLGIDCDDFDDGAANLSCP
jgi:hypothetical protein